MDIQPYEKMAKLRLDEKERAWAEGMMDKLSQSFTALAEVDTDGIAPLVSPLDMENVFREDIAAQLVSRETLLAAAPASYDGYYEVPRTIE
ncbi:MAG: Asp-tRNA(Asn)/Glu-tRNA(Gln) amidotransferase subunit GatC [Clostridiales bacterium]|nr:Asp-tRNA(Asn)/Glu-tRNA(Gln) amidotransferase subunit GatC [Clostridiales bacterium]